jgi:hypothetical protein
VAKSIFQGLTSRNIQIAQIGLLLGGISLLLVEIRFEHQAVLVDKWQAWIPIVYLALSLLFGSVALVCLRSFGKNLLIVLFSGLAVIGIAGFCFHSLGKPVKQVSEVVSVDFSPPGQLKPDDGEDSHPPVLAPLALVGLGLLGILTCLIKTEGVG